MCIAMMIGMMTLSLARMVLLYARVGRSLAAQGKAFCCYGGLSAGGLRFAVAVTGAKWLLEVRAAHWPDDRCGK
jgi:predicted metal-binding membrane protein